MSAPHLNDDQDFNLQVNGGAGQEKLWCHNDAYNHNTTFRILFFGGPTTFSRDTRKTMMRVSTWDLDRSESDWSGSRLTHFSYIFLCSLKRALGHFPSALKTFFFFPLKACFPLGAVGSIQDGFCFPFRRGSFFLRTRRRRRPG